MSRILKRADCSNVATLAYVAENAVRNGDLDRALEVLREIGEAMRSDRPASMGERRRTR